MLHRVTPFLVCLLAVFAACEARVTPPAEDSTTAPFAVTDDLGRAVAVESPVGRILTLAPNLTELVAAAGGADRLAGHSQADNFPSGLDGLPLFSTYPLDFEGVVALEPDLLLANAAINRPDDADRLDGLGVPTYFFSFDEVADVPAALRTIGDLLGTRGEAEAAAERFEARIEPLRVRTHAQEERPRVLLLIGDETLYAFGGASYTQELIRLAGGESVTGGFEGEGVTLSEEFVIEAQPEVIVGAFGPDFAPQRWIDAHPAFRDLPAVRNGRVVGIDPDLLLRPGPRLADGAEALARAIHPDAFGSGR